METFKKTAAKVTVEAVKEGWIHRGEKVAVGDRREVTELQAAKLREKGLVK